MIKKNRHFRQYITTILRMQTRHGLDLLGGNGLFTVPSCKHRTQAPCPRTSFGTTSFPTHRYYSVCVTAVHTRSLMRSRSPASFAGGFRSSITVPICTCYNSRGDGEGAGAAAAAAACFVEDVELRPGRYKLRMASSFPIP